MSKYNMRKKIMTADEILAKATAEVKAKHPGKEAAVDQLVEIIKSKLAEDKKS